MKDRGLVYGVLDTSQWIPDAAVAAKCRDLTITWSRYDYHGPIIERSTIDAIISQATDLGFQYCFIQSYGQIVRERWNPDPASDHDSQTALTAWMREHRVLAAGRILTDADGWYGLDHRCLMVDLETYVRCGRPQFGTPQIQSRELPTVAETRHAGNITSLQSSGGSMQAVPRQPGWNFVQASLRQGIPVRAMPTSIRQHVLDLQPDSPPHATALAEIFAHGIDSGGKRAPSGELTDEQKRFFESVRLQTENARRGVFLLNIEAYHDVETPPAGLPTPVSSLYAVASGFKPNRILQTHGMDRNTRVVFFDYSVNALAVRRTMVNEWDGDDFPGFVRHLFGRFPPPDTFYQLWADATPDTLDWSTFKELWDRELARLGGPHGFREHWSRYRSLPHTYVHCDVLTAPEPLLTHVRHEPGAVMWFSNAPFTMYSNWRHSLDQRKAKYDRWIEQLAQRNPDMLLYGSDYNNSNVNCISAGEYWRLYQEQDGGPLEPADLYHYEVRM